MRGRFRRAVTLLSLPILFLLSACSSRSGAAPAAQPQIAAAAPPISANTSVASAAPAVAVAPPRATDAPILVSSRAISHGNPAMPAVAIDFDVGAGYEPATQLLDILRARHAAATFFVMGWLARAHPETLAAIARAGFAIGSHGDSVPDLTQVAPTQVAADLEAADSAIRQVTGATTRPLWSPSAGYQNASVREVAAGMGYDTILWSIDAGDWRTDATAAGVEQAVLSALAPGSIVVMHYDSEQSHTATVAALPVILDAIQARGLALAPVSTLVRQLPP